MGIPPRQDCPYSVERVSPGLRDSLARTPPPFLGSRAFGCWLRHEWFGPLVTADRGFTLAHRFQGQCVLDLLPLSTHESPVLLATPNRSGLRPSFPARPICCSAFRLWSASLALPTAWPVELAGTSVVREILAEEGFDVRCYRGHHCSPRHMNVSPVSA